MVSADAIRTTVGIIGNIISLILFLSPVPTFIKIWKKGSVEQFSAVPYVATSFNCGMWVLYGVPRFHKNALLVLTINATGFGIELIYLTLFLIYSDKKQRLKVALIMVAELAVIVVIGLLVSSFVRNIDHRTTIIGSICMLGNVLMYASPLSIMKTVIRTKSVEYMPFFLSLFSFLNGACWSTYALIRIDPYIVAPNGLGVLFSTAQLILYATYYKSTQRQIAARQTKGGEVGMAHTQNGHV